MWTRRLHRWIGAPAVVGGVLVATTSAHAADPILLTAGLVGLGGLTFASERWRRADAGEPASAAHAAEAPSAELP